MLSAAGSEGELPATILSEWVNGERGRNRTFNLLIKSQLLCQLSYAPFAFGMKKRGYRKTLSV
jgi:hypothetical protein